MTGGDGNVGGTGTGQGEGKEGDDAIDDDLIVRVDTYNDEDEDEHEVGLELAPGEDMI